MVSSSKWRVNGECAYKNKDFVNCIFILARNYIGFVVDMDSLVQLHLHFSKDVPKAKAAKPQYEKEPNRDPVLQNQNK